MGYFAGWRIVAELARRSGGRVQEAVARALDQADGLPEASALASCR